MFYEPAWFLTQHFKQPIGSLLSSPRPKRPLFVLHLINSPSAQGKFCVQHCISSPSEATIKYKRIQIAQGPSCETDPLSPFGGFLLATPIAVGVNLTCIRSKLVKKHSSMREAISKIFSKGEQEKWRHCLKPRLNILQFCTRRLLALHQPVCENETLKGRTCPQMDADEKTGVKSKWPLCYKPQSHPHCSAAFYPLFLATTTKKKKNVHDFGGHVALSHRATNSPAFCAIRGVAGLVL